MSHFQTWDTERGDGLLQAWDSQVYGMEFHTCRSEKIKNSYLQMWKFIPTNIKNIPKKIKFIPETYAKYWIFCIYICTCHLAWTRHLTDWLLHYCDNLIGSNCYFDWLTVCLKLSSPHCDWTYTICDWINLANRQQPLLIRSMINESSTLIGSLHIATSLNSRFSLVFK